MARNQNAMSKRGITPRSTQPEPDKTPRQPVHESIYASDDEETHAPEMPKDRGDWTPCIEGEWGTTPEGEGKYRTPEPGNVTADMREGGTIMHKPFKLAWVEPFPRAWPYKVKKDPGPGWGPMDH